MALIEGTFTADIKALLQECNKGEKDSDYFAGKLASLITEYIKTATVTVEMGIPVSTTGSATAQTGITTAPGTGTLS